MFLEVKIFQLIVAQILIAVVLVSQAEQAQQEACDKFEAMSAKAKEELVDFKKRRVVAFKKNLIDLTELEIKHSKVRKSNQTNYKPFILFP